MKFINTLCVTLGFTIQCVFFFPFAFLSLGLQKKIQTSIVSQSKWVQVAKFQPLCLGDYTTYDTWFEKPHKDQNVASLFMASLHPLPTPPVCYFLLAFWSTRQHHPPVCLAVASTTAGADVSYSHLLVFENSWKAVALTSKEDLSPWSWCAVLTMTLCLRKEPIDRLNNQLTCLNVQRLQFSWAWKHPNETLIQILLLSG